MCICGTVSYTHLDVYKRQTYGGDGYEIGAASESTGELFVTIARSDGTIDERWIEITGDSMTVYDVVPMTMREKGSPIGTFYRAS